MILDDLIEKPYKFNWDEGNINTSYLKHKISSKESEEPFFNEQNIIFIDGFHFEQEDRYILIGKTQAGRVLFIAFTVRGNNIRIISARPANKKEVLYYEKEVSVT